ncbi:MAG: DUF488 family protein [Acidobacteria bacterium]|nr:DUF488 family protein [Acidobacteriota bacterium]MBI3655168.1 DUF488 family protein [Acidobacteriota bacterium]
MPIRIVRLGTPRSSEEGIRIGTVRRPPRGVPKSEYASRDLYDVWLPEVAPSEVLVKLALSADTEAQWRTFTRRYRAELAKPEKARLLQLLAALSQVTSLSVGCYCADEERCHRSILRELLVAHGASVA